MTLQFFVYLVNTIQINTIQTLPSCFKEGGFEGEKFCKRLLLSRCQQSFNNKIRKVRSDYEKYNFESKRKYVEDSSHC